MSKRRRSTAKNTRRSGRSKKMTGGRTLVMDAEQQKEATMARLAALEDDNYVELGDDDDDYNIDEEEYVGSKKKKKLSKKERFEKPIKETNIRVLQEVIDSAQYDQDAKDQPNYSRAVAKPSIYPPRCFCAVCGFEGSYSCPICGTYFCSLQCQFTHRETRCVTFGHV